MQLNWKKLILTLGCFGLIICLQGCNTVKGFGQDVQKGGESLERAASQHTQ